jgi:hypothetical protein
MAKRFDPDHELAMRILAALAVHYPQPMPDPETVLFALTNGNREELLMHVMFLQGLGFMRSNIVELFHGGSGTPWSAARFSWGTGPVLTRKGLNAHLGVVPIVW